MSEMNSWGQTCIEKWHCIVNISNVHLLRYQLYGICVASNQLAYRSVLMESRLDPPVVHVTSTSETMDGEASSLHRRNGAEHYKHRFLLLKKLKLKK